MRNAEKLSLRTDLIANELITVDFITADFIVANFIAAGVVVVFVFWRDIKNLETVFVRQTPK